MHKCIIVAPPALRFARVSSFISLRVTPPAPSNPAKLISSSISAFHYRVHSHGTRERANTREKLQEAISPSHFQPSIISCIDESSPFFRLSLLFFSFFRTENRKSRDSTILRANTRRCINSVDKIVDVGYVGKESCVALSMNIQRRGWMGASTARPFEYSVAA